MRNVLHCSCLLTDLKPVNLHNNCLDIEYVPLNHIESQRDNDVPLKNVNTPVDEQQKVSKIKLKAKKTNSKYLFCYSQIVFEVKLLYRGWKKI